MPYLQLVRIQALWFMSAWATLTHEIYNSFDVSPSLDVRDNVWKYLKPLTELGMISFFIK